MAYEYESITNGVFNFTIPGENRTVKLFRGSKVIVENELSGSYLRVLKFLGEVNNIVETVVETPKPKAKVEDKITTIKETIEDVTVVTEDVVSEVKEEVTPAPKGKRRK